MSREVDSDWSDLAACLRHALSRSTDLPVVGDWPQMVERARAHRVAPLLARMVDRADAETRPAADVVDALHAAAAAATVRSLGALAALRELAAAFLANGIPFIAWKGPTLAQQAWGDATLRLSDDIDVVVLPASRHEARAIARSLGWVSRHAMTDSQEDVVFRSQRAYELTRRGEPSLLEIHWAFGARRYRGFPDAAAVIGRSTTRDVGGIELPVPSAADALLLHAVHATKHGWSTLEDVAVFAALLSADPAVTGRASELARVHSAGLAFALGEALVEQVLGSDAIARTPSRGNIAERSRLRARLDEVLARWSAGATTWRPTLRWDLAWTQRPSDRLLLLARSMLDPTLQEWNAVQLPARLGALYRVIRPARLVLRAFRR